MKEFSKIYQTLKPSIVAIASKISLNSEFSDIIGTGFIIRSDGVILTNNHVIEAIKSLPRLKKDGPEDWPITILYFHLEPEIGMYTIPLEVKGIGHLGREKPAEGYNYGPDIPDLGFIRVHVKNLPSLKVAEKLNLNEGDEVMLAGFPMGTKTLTAPGWLHQLTPTLQSGIISAILPFSCENPHAMILNIMTQGGSSGSPIFNPSTGEVIGIEYGGIEEPIKLIEGAILPMNTSLTLAIPTKIINEVCQKLEEVEEFKIDTSNFETIESLIEKNTKKVMQPKEGGFLKPIGQDEVV